MSSKKWKPSKRMELTAAVVKQLKSDSLQYDVWDDAKDSPPGFGVRVNPKGSKTYQVLTRALADGERKATRIALGRVGEISLMEARKRAREARERGRVEDIRPTEVKRQKQLKAESERLERQRAEKGRFGTAFENFIKAKELRKTRPHTIAGYRGAARRVKKLHDRMLDEITRPEVSEAIDAIHAEGKHAAANRTRAVLRTFFNWAIDGELLQGANPVPRAHTDVKESSRERLLFSGEGDGTEIGVLWRAAEALSPVRCAFTRFCLLMGQRANETVGMRWSEIDDDALLWRIPAERTKNRKDHVLPLSCLAYETIKPLKHEGCDFVFVDELRADASKPVSVRSTTRMRDAVHARAKEIAEAEGLDGAFTELWVYHDLRRAISTGMSCIGIDEVLADRILSHTHTDRRLPIVARTYLRKNYVKEMRAALERWADTVIDLAEGRKRQNVVMLSAHSEVPREASNDAA